MFLWLGGVGLVKKKYELYICIYIFFITDEPSMANLRTLYGDPNLGVLIAPATTSTR